VRRPLTAYSLLAFPLTVLLLFTLAPTVAGLAMSLFSWDGSGSPTWVGLDNFARLARDGAFGPALRNTLVFVAASVPATVILAFVLAVAVNAKWFVGKAAVRTIFFLPTVVSIVAIGFVWKWLLEADAGLVSAAARGIGWSEHPTWLQDGSWPMVWIVLISIWRGVGFCLVLYLAALSAVNESLYEAAEMDGASRVSVMRHITWPQVAPMTVFLLVTGVIGALQVFDIVFVMTGLAADSPTTNVLNLAVYRQFTYGSYGYASAIGVVIFLLTLAATGVQLRLFARRNA